MSLFATVAITGLAYYLSGPKLAIGCIVFGALGLVAMHLFGGKEKTLPPLPTPTKIETTDSFSPIFTQTGPIIYLPPNTPVPDPLPQYQPPKDKEAHIEQLQLEKRALYIDNDGAWRIGRPKNTNFSAVGFLLPFYFDPQTSDIGAYVEYAKVKLVLTDTKDPSIKIRVAHACWLNVREDSVDIESGETKHIVLAAAVEVETVGLFAFSTNRTNLNLYETLEHTLEILELTATVYKVEAVLIWGGGSQFRKIFEVSFDAATLLPS